MAADIYWLQGYTQSPKIPGKWTKGRNNPEGKQPKQKQTNCLSKKNKQERKWSTAARVLTINIKIATSFSFPELHANKLINKSLLVVDLNIDCCDTIICRDLIRSLGIDIHCVEMTIS